MNPRDRHLLRKQLSRGMTPEEIQAANGWDPVYYAEVYAVSGLGPSRSTRDRILKSTAEVEVLTKTVEGLLQVIQNLDAKIVQETAKLDDKIAKAEDKLTKRLAKLEKP